MEGILNLINILPGDAAMKKRSQVTDIINRYLAGDASLISEVEANAKSNHPIALMFRANLESTAMVVDDDTQRSRKRQRLLEDMEIEEKQLMIEGLAITNRIREEEAQKAANENKKLVAETLKIIEDTKALEREKEAVEKTARQIERTRPMKMPSVYFKGILRVFTDKYMSGFSNSAKFNRENIFHFHEGGGGVEFVTVLAKDLYKQFMWFLEHLHNVGLISREPDFHNMIRRDYPCIVKLYKKSKSDERYEIDCDKLKAHLQKTNGYDADYFF